MEISPLPKLFCRRHLFIKYAVKNLNSIHSLSPFHCVFGPQIENDLQKFARLTLKGLKEANPS